MALPTPVEGALEPLGWGRQHMWTITLRDLQFRRRQFAIAVVGAGLAFALVLTGMSE